MSAQNKDRLEPLGEEAEDASLVESYESEDAADAGGEADREPIRDPATLVEDTEPTDEDVEGQPEAEDETGRPAEEDLEEEPVELPPRLAAAAERARLDPQDVEKLGDKAIPLLENLANTFDDLSTRYGRLGDLEQPARREPPIGGASRRGRVPPAQPQQDPLADPLQVDLDADEWGEDLRDKFAGPVQERLNALREEVLRLREMEEVREMQSVEREVDGFFADQGIQKAYGDVFGDGSTARMARGSPEYRAREEVLRDADAAMRAAADAGRDMSVRDALDRAVYYQMRDRTQEQARRQVQEKVQKRSRQIIQRPSKRRTQRKGGPSPRSAEQAYAELAAELGEDVAE